MACQFQLPIRFRYLQPFRKQLASLPPEEVGENIDPSLLNKVLRDRIQGLSAEQASKLLDEDRKELGNWLSAPERTNDRLHYLLGYFLVSPKQLVQYLQRSLTRSRSRQKAKFA